MVKVTSQVKNEELPSDIRSLVELREEARLSKDFAKSDELRQQLADLGYLINDKQEGYEILKIGDSQKKPGKSYLVLFGSGENAPSSVDIYRQLFLTLGKRDLKIALITTPAGFQPNVKLVYQEIKDFLLTSLPDFNLTINIVFANTKEDADNPKIVSQIDGADIIFTGPGSPTFAAKVIKNTILSKKIIVQVKKGSTLILASAASIAFSRFALPVYEIYKVGDDLHWEDGLDLYRELWRPATIIPHFNNNEGGAGLDTSHCFMGQERFSKLKSLLPANEYVLGLDEHTAYIVDLESQEISIRGKGSAYSI